MVLKIPVTFKVYAPVDDNMSTLTHTFWEQLGTSDKTAGLFFEIVSPMININDGKLLVQKFWEAFLNKYKQDSDFEKALGVAVKSLQTTLNELGFEEGIDANFAVFVSEPEQETFTDAKDAKRLMKLAVVGQLDLILIRGSKFSDLTEYLDINADLSKIEYNEIDLHYQDVLLVSNKGVVTNLLFGGLLELDNMYQLVNSLEQSVVKIPGGKKIAMMIFSELDLQKAKEVAQVKTEGSKLKTLELAGLLSKTQGLKDIFKEVVERTKDLSSSLIGKTRSLKVKTPKDKPLPPNVVVLPKPPQEPIESPQHSVVGSSLEQSDTSNQPLHDINKDSELLAKGKEEVVHLQLDSNTPGVMDKDSNIVGSDAPDVSNTSAMDTNITDFKNDTSPQFSGQTASTTLGPQGNYDPVEYLRNRRKPGYKLGAKVSGLFSGLVGKLSKAKASKPLGEYGATPTKYVNNKAKFKVYALLVIVLIILGGVWYRKYSMRKYDKQLITEFKETYYVPIVDLYNNKISKLVAQDPDNYIGQCLTKVDELNNAYESYKLNFKIKDSLAELDSYKEQALEYKQKCKERYYTLYNITRVSDQELNVLKDFKVALGQDSNPVDLDIYQGVVMVLDAGKKAVYKVNSENGEISKLQDSGNYIQEPVSLAIGTETTFVCDRKSGVLYYSEAKHEFVPVRGTSVDVLGEVCSQVDTFGKNVYFSTEAGNVIYKVVGLGGLRYAPPVKYVEYADGSIIDIAIDGSIYALVERNDSASDIVRFFGGRFDPSFKLSEDVKNRFNSPERISTNPSGNFPIYVYDSKLNSIFVVEKPDKDRHPGVGTLVATYELPESMSKVNEISAMLSVVSNQETSLYILGQGVLKTLKLQ